MTLLKSVYLSALSSFLLYGVSAQTAPQFGQCGGMGWTGPTTCPAGWACTFSNPWYSQCLVGSATTTVSSSTAGTGSTSNTASSTSTASGGSATLVPGWSFIRAVEDPNFHKYLQSQVPNVADTVVLGDHTSAAQFQIVNGQLIQNAAGTKLYAVVTPPADSTVVKLGLTWSTTPDTLGTFVFSGDTVEWSSPTVKRAQTNAWLVCPNGAILTLYINLGPYAFNTPAGCADETIHAYTGATAVP
ncbi:carbohydrate-binding module family 1 protein [Mycena crocata]|nr:carbohydrate-binding module family 1 protein [Mycena crocata]